MRYYDTQILLICQRYELGRDIAKVIYDWVMHDIRIHQRKSDTVRNYINGLKKSIVELEDYDDENGDEKDVNYGELYKICRNKDLFKHYVYHQGLDHLPIVISCSKLPGSDCVIDPDEGFTAHEYYHGYVYRETFAYRKILEKRVRFAIHESVRVEIGYKKAYDYHLKHYHSYKCPFCLLNESNGIEREEDWHKQRYIDKYEL